MVILNELNIFIKPTVVRIYKQTFLYYGSFLTTVPRVLADIYQSLGTQLPEALVAVLPADFFSDESVAKDSISPSACLPPSNSLALDGKDRLQDLRNRSANKRR